MPSSAHTMPPPIPVLSPGDPGWDDARRAWNLTVDQHPAAIARPTDAAGVAAAVRTARDRGLRIAPQGTGHGAGPLGDLDDSLLLRTAGLRELRIDVAGRRATVGAGVLWQELLDAVSPHGLLALAGSAPDVGVVGSALTGGIGWCARALGLASESVLAVDLVTADGEQRRVDADSDPDLFWALRGGGGSFAVVTAIELRLFAAPALHGGALFWPIEQAERVLRGWADWTGSAPTSVTTAARILRLPPLPSVPEPLRGRQLVAIDGAVLGDAATTDELLRPLRALRPHLDGFAAIEPAGLTRIHGDPDAPVPSLSAHAVLHAVPQQAVDAFVAAAGAESGSRLLAAELRQLGGALAVAPAGHGALGRIDAGFCAFAVGLPQGPGDGPAVVRDADAVIDALAPWHAPGRILNFTEGPADPADGFGDADYRRLRQIKARVDPDDVVRANFAIPPA